MYSFVAYRFVEHLYLFLFATWFKCHAYKYIQCTPLYICIPAVEIVVVHIRGSYLRIRWDVPEFSASRFTVFTLLTALINKILWHFSLFFIYKLYAIYIMILICCRPIIWYWTLRRSVHSSSIIIVNPRLTRAQWSLKWRLTLIRFGGGWRLDGGWRMRLMPTLQQTLHGYLSLPLC